MYSRLAVITVARAAARAVGQLAAVPVVGCSRFRRRRSRPAQARQPAPAAVRSERTYAAGSGFL